MKKVKDKISTNQFLLLRSGLRKCVFLLFWLFGATSLFAQQDPQYSQYMFNQMAINPAYAGSREVINTSAFFRSQWTGFDGAPTTETFTVNAPLPKKNVGLGLTVIADQIGPLKSVGALGSYAYRIKVREGKLSFGLRFGVYQYIFNWNQITYKDPADVYNSKNQTSTIVPTADAGLYYYTNSMYAGFSATHLYSGHLTDITSQNGEFSQLSPHLFFTFGKAWSLSEKLIFNPSCMIKYVANTPATADLNLSFLLDQRIWMGVSVRSSYGVVVYTQFHITDKFKLGYSYDFGINAIGRAGGGSHEIMLSYDFKIPKAKYFSPRYF